MMTGQLAQASYPVASREFYIPRAVEYSVYPFDKIEDDFPLLLRRRLVLFADSAIHAEFCPDICVILDRITLCA